MSTVGYQKAQEPIEPTHNTMIDTCALAGNTYSRKRVPVTLLVLGVSPLALTNSSIYQKR